MFNVADFTHNECKMLEMGWKRSYLLSFSRQDNQSLANYRWSLMQNSSRPWTLGQCFGLKHRLCTCSSHVFTNPEFSTCNRFFKQECIFGAVQLRTVIRTQGLFSQLSKIGPLYKIAKMFFAFFCIFCIILIYFEYLS